VASYKDLFNQAMSVLGYFQSHSKLNAAEDPEVMRRYLASEVVRLRAEAEVVALSDKVRALEASD